MHKFIRSPKVIIGEIAALALFSAVGAARMEWHVFGSVWFVAITAITAASLSIVVVGQCHRLRAAWRLHLTESHFKAAPFRAEFERPATAMQPQVNIWSERRLGLAGSFVFHCGLLLIIIAGMLRALFATEAVTDVVENETLAAQAGAWAGQFPGVLAKPFALDREIILREVKATRYPDGDLKSLSLRFAVDGAEREVQINEEVRVNGRRIYVGHEFGPAAYVEWKRDAATPPEKQCLMLPEAGPGKFEGKLAVSGNLRVYLRSHIDDAGNRSGLLEARVMNGGALVSAAELPVGGTLALPDGGSLTLHSLPMWTRLHGSRDAALPLAFAGMLLAMLGAAMIFTLIKLDFCVVVMPLGERERVFVALKPQRFAPLFQERFEELVRELGGDSGTAASSYPCSAGWQPAVSPTGSRQDSARGNGADCQSATQPTTSRRYDVDGPTVRVATVLLLMGLLVFTAGCDRVSPAQARQLVERYNKYVSEAYRRGDIKLVDPVVGPNEGKKLTGLIGVRLDLDMTLDAHLLALEVTGVERAKDELRVRTRERWTYQNLKIGTGDPVGAASDDSYEMLYVFKKEKQDWLVDEIQFTAPPKVGTTNAPWVADRSMMHGTMAPSAGKETNAP